MAEHDAAISLFRDGSRVYARLTGPVAAESVPAFEQRLGSATASGCAGLVLDLGAADFLDSDGTRWLQRLQSELEARGIELRLALREGSREERTLKLLRLDGAFVIERYPSESPAAPALSPG